MKIIVARTAGFCMGVNRVVDLAVDSTSKKNANIYSLGPLIHNTQTLAMLQERGITILTPDMIPADGSTILIRAHGIPPKTLDQYVNAEENYKIIDGTCPKVKTVHKVIQKYCIQGYKIVITGDQGHAEVVGLLGYTGDQGYLIQKSEDLDSLPEFDKVCLVSQTTFSGKTFDAIAAKLKERYPQAQIVVKKTICAATKKRQQEIRKIAQETDALIVVGGRNSANTLRLAKIAHECGVPTQHIETERDIDWKKLSQSKTIGLTAGASTPAWMIKRIIDHLLFLERMHKRTILNILSHFFEIGVNVNLFVAAGGAVMYYASGQVQELPFRYSGAIVAFLYLIAIYLWNSLACIEKNKHLDISRYRFYNANKSGLTILTYSCIILLSVISYIHSLSLFYLMIVATTAGIVYNFTIVPRALRKYFKYSNLKDIPTSRDLFAALAWAVLITLIPHVANNTFIIRPATVAIFLWTFILAYLRSLIFDLRDIEGDRIMGRETLVTIIGEKKVKGLIFSALLVSFLVLMFLFLLTSIFHYHLSNTSPYLFILQIPVLLHLWLLMKWYPKLTHNFSTIFNVLVDGQFFIVGIGVGIVEFI